MHSIYGPGASKLGVTTLSVASKLGGVTTPKQTVRYYSQRRVAWHVVLIDPSKTPVVAHACDVLHCY